MKTTKILFLLLWVLLSCSYAAAETFDEELGRARGLVEVRDYSQALRVYEGFLKSSHDDPQLMIEWARVYTYADQHAQAIGLFEEIRRRYPAHEKDIIRELADQYKWNGQLAQAIGAYRRALEVDPQDIMSLLGLAQALAWSGQREESLKEYSAALQRSPDSVLALLGKAEILSWNDKLEQANSLYRKVLQIEPQNLAAKNALARNTVWQSYNRQGIELFQEILQQYPDDVDALEGLAHAYHWDGQDGMAIKTLEKVLALAPARNAARDLYSDIGMLKKLNVNQSNRYSSDSNHLYVLANNVHVGKYLDEATKVGATYARYTYRQPGRRPIAGDRGGLDVSHRFNEFLEIDSYAYATDYRINGFHPVTTNTWVTLHPGDMWKWYLGYDRETFEDIQALQDKIIVNSGSLSFDFKPDRFWLFSARYKRSSYSDDNNQNTAFADIQYRINQEPYVKLYYNFYYSDWSEALDHGYFNPRSIQSHAIGAYASRDLTSRLFVDGQASTGYEKQNPKSSHPTYFGAVSLNYRLGRSWVVSARGEYFNALDTNPDKSYSKTTAWLNFTYSFGPEPVRPYQSTQPQRPTGN